MPDIPSVPTLIGLKHQEASEDEAGNRTYTLTYEIMTPLRWGSRAAASVLPFVRGDYYLYDIAHGGVADSGSGFESDAFALCRNITVRQTSSDGANWDGICEFGPPQLDGDGSIVAAADPTEAPYRSWWESEPYEALAEKDIDGNPIVNTAKDKFDPTLTRVGEVPVLIIERDEATFDDTVIDNYVGRYNNATFFGRAAGTMLLRKISPTPMWSTLIGSYFRVRYEFAFKPPDRPDWKHRILNAGMRQVVSGEYKPILVKGVPVSEPVPLALNGSAFLGPPDDSDLVYLTVDVQGSANFGDFAF